MNDDLTDEPRYPNVVADLGADLAALAQVVEQPNIGCKTGWLTVTSDAWQEDKTYPRPEVQLRLPWRYSENMGWWQLSMDEGP